MKMTHINTDVPVWEITDFDLPTVDWQHDGILDQGNNNPVKDLRRLCKIDNDSFIEAWKNHTQQLETFLSEEAEEIPTVKPLWMGRMEGIQVGVKELTVINDFPGFKMSRHLDNRTVVGVLIINLQDNPENSSTNFWSHNWDDKDPWYSSPTKAGTGVFMLNSWNTRHDIDFSVDQSDSRLIGYQVIGINALIK